MLYKKNKKCNSSLKKPLLWAICSSLVAILLGVGVFTYLFLDVGEKTVIQVPDLVGKSIAEIEGAQYDHFEIDKEPIYSDTHEKGVVISQSPRENSRRVFLGEDITIKLRVSLGREELTMPDLCGYDCYEAARIMRELSMSVRFVYLSDGDYKADEVIKSSPSPDTPIEKGYRVTLFVHREKVKPTVRVRNLCGMKQEEAVRALMRDGLTLGKVDYIPSDEESDRTVAFQGLPEGAVVKWGTRIDITVTKSGQASGFYNGDTIENEIEDNTENGE